MAALNKNRLIALGFAAAMTVGYGVQQFGGGTLPAEAAQPQIDLQAQAEQAVQLIAQHIVPELPNMHATPVPRLNNASGLDTLTTGDTGPSDATMPALRSGSLAMGCEISFVAHDVGMGAVELILNAPCHLNERVRIEHAGMAFVTSTSESGGLEVGIPALDKKGVFTLTFTDGDQVMAQTAVSDLENHHRVALNWAGRANLGIHIFEFGAGYGDYGHVWQGAPRNILAAMDARGGYLTRLGNPNLPAPQIAEIYSFPSSTIDRPGQIRINVEAEITSQNCNRNLSARSTQKWGSEQIQWTDLSLSIPECSAVGDFLVLKNLLQDLNIARN